MILIRDCVVSMCSVQDHFARYPAHGLLATTHLIMKHPSGDKYSFSIKWGVPAVTDRWGTSTCSTFTNRIVSFADYTNYQCISVKYKCIMYLCVLHLFILNCRTPNTLTCAIMFHLQLVVCLCQGSDHCCHWLPPCQSPGGWPTPLCAQPPLVLGSPAHFSTQQCSS